MLRELVLSGMPLVLACAGATTNASSGAAPAGTGQSDEAGRQELSRLEDDWAKAYETHDSAFFARVLSPDFHGTADSANTFGKADAVRNAADMSVVETDIQDHDRQIRLYGQGSVGVVTGQTTWTVARGVRPGRYNGRYTEVFARQPDGRWQAIAGHYSMGSVTSSDSARQPTAAPGVDKAAEERAIRDKEQQWRAALTARDSTAIGAFYASDGFYLPQESAGYEGRAAVSGRWLGERAGGLTELEREPKRIEVSDAGDMAYEVGTYKVRGYSKRGGLGEAAGNYVTVWKKVDGDWKTAAYIWNRGAKQ